MIQLSQPIRTATHLGWTVVSLPHSGEHLQVAYSLLLEGNVVEQNIKTITGLINNGNININDITAALIEALAD